MRPRCRERGVKDTYDTLCRYRVWGDVELFGVEEPAGVTAGGDDRHMDECGYLCECRRVGVRIMTRHTAAECETRTW